MSTPNPFPQKKILSLKQKKLKFISNSVGTQPTKVPTEEISAQPLDVRNSEKATTTTRPTLSGLCNQGNTCYANCILQVLRFCPQFSAEIAKLSDTFSAHAKKDDKVKEQSLPEDEADGENEGAMVIALNMVKIEM